MALVTVQRSPTPSTSSSPCVSESGSGEDDRRSQPRSISESFLTVKGAALFLPRGNGTAACAVSRVSQLRSKHAGDIQQHLQTMFTLLRPEDNIKLAVRLESIHAQVTRYMVVVSTNGRQDTEESVVLGMDFSPLDSSCSVGLVLPLWSDTLIHLDGDGGFSVSTDNRVHIFKPVSVQAMWSALQSLHKACEVARCHNYFPGSLFLTWVSYYQSRVSSDQALINEWNAMQDLQSHRADSPVLFSDVPTERELTERQIKGRLREIMMQKDLENVTCKEIRTELEMNMTCNLREFKGFIDKEMIVILGQMDSPTEIFEHVFLGSEWNASNLEELQNSGVQFILNVTREIDNFFPGVFEYHNIRVYDEEATDLLAYWNETYKFISRAKKAGSKCLVHCKMGVSRSAATVIAYAMKEYGWELNKAFDYVKERRAVTKPNPSFMRQLEEYQGILMASKQRHNKLWRSHSDSDLSDHHEPLSKSSQPLSLGRSDPHNQSSSKPGPSVKELLESLGTLAAAAAATTKPSESGGCGLMDCPVRPRQLSASLPEEATVPPAGGSSRSLESTAGCVSPSPAALANGSCDSEVPLPPPSQPRAAAVVPEIQWADKATVAQSVSVGQPHPPPSFYQPQAAGAPCPSTPVPVKKADCDRSPNGPAELPVQSATAAAAAASAPCPGAIPQDSEVLLGHTSDHINFFSAREKFKGMSQDGRGCQLRNCGPQPQEPLLHEAKEDERRKEPSAPVQVTGPKPAVHTQPPTLPSHGQPDLHGPQQQGADDGESLSQKEADRAREEAKRQEEEEAAAPAGLCSDWTRGSVRRVTRQLEQRMKQEQETPALSSSPPSASAATLCFPPRRPASVHLASGSGPQDPSLCLQVAVVGSVREEPEADGKAKGGEEMTARAVAGTSDQSAKSPKLLPAGGLQSSLQRSAHSPFASVNFLCLEGVTELETATDWEPPAEGPQCQDVLKKTWETLCELGAFLQQVSGGGGSGAFRPKCGTSRDDQNRVGRSVQRRVSEVEARIRQAGLTPPSLMKRSASLAKLGCLELLANELSEWERRRSPVPPSEAEPHGASDEAKKKQRVQTSVPSAEQPAHADDAVTVAADKHSDAGETSPLPPPSLQSTSSTNENPAAGLHCDSELDSHLPPSALKTSKQQYGRTHPLRRLKKRTTSTLYHTM